MSNSKTTWVNRVLAQMGELGDKRKIGRLNNKIKELLDQEDTALDHEIKQGSVKKEYLEDELNDAAVVVDMDRLGDFDTANEYAVEFLKNLRNRIKAIDKIDERIAECKEKKGLNSRSRKLL